MPTIPAMRHREGRERSGNRQHLLFDADDTLWENNMYFEQAFADFVTFLNHEHLSTAEIQAVMDELQIANRATHGFGARSFARSLRDTFRHITGVPDDDPDLDSVGRMGLRILDQHFEIMDGVLETIDALRPYHDLMMVTKGHLEEQKLKVERSGIEQHFDAVMIVDEKDEHVYRSIVDSLDLDPRLTWMIGNSPRSDVNPAIRAGINAVYIPHPRTWHLEVEEVLSVYDPSQTLLQLSRFSELTSVFAPRGPGIPATPTTDPDDRAMTNSNDAPVPGSPGAEK
ncbi:MAG: HAD family hydrolase [Chloroflexota bacterium]|nr:HAD family hydrolase [Chloroflexota bacterium]